MDEETLKIIRAMTPAQKLQAAQRLYESAKQLKAAALRSQHPDWTEDQIHQAVRDAFLYARE